MSDSEISTSFEPTKNCNQEKFRPMKNIKLKIKFFKISKVILFLDRYMSISVQIPYLVRNKRQLPERTKDVIQRRKTLTFASVQYSGALQSRGAEGASAPTLPPKFSGNVPFFFAELFFWKYLIWNSKYSIVLRMPWVELTINGL